MILYHYTARVYLPAIARDGLSLGDVPVNPTDGFNAVWLTTASTADGHGLSDGRELDAEEKRLAGAPPGARLYYANKREIRFAVKIPSSDRRLVYWPRWARKRLSPAWYSTLNEIGGKRADTWWLYWGVLPPHRLSGFDLAQGIALQGWPDAFLGIDAQIVRPKVAGRINLLPAPVKFAR